MKLNEYIKKQNYTQAKFIEQIEQATGHKLPQGTLAKYILAQRTPRKKELNIIYKATKGEVTPNDFYLE